MKKFLLSFLAFVIMLPGFACAMPACGGVMGAHCPHHMDRAAQGPMLMKDCAKVDFQKTGGFVLAKPDPGQSFFIAAALLPPPALVPAPPRSIRAPPPGWPPPALAQPSIILTTQRFRE